MKIKFFGATREVTGSKHLIVTNHGKKLLLDCGMFQGKGLNTDAKNREIFINPEEIDHIILTHSHIDHSGLIPFYYKLGFRGSIICTDATRDLCSIMLADAGHIQEQDVYTFNKKRIRQGLPTIEPLYTADDAFKCMSLFYTIPYDRKLQIDENIKVKFTNTGHLLGSGVAIIEIKEGSTIKRIGYTGDIGRPVNRILKPPVSFPQVDYLIVESTYGDRLHEDLKAADEKLLEIVFETCVKKRGKLLIPSFSVGRTQEIVYTLNNFYNEGKLPKIEVYVDSPLAINATEIFRMHTECFNKDILNVMLYDSDPFGFNTLHYIKRVEDSKKLNYIEEPCIIISASGMMEAGRIKHHLANNISKPSTTVLAVGYCAPETLGARLLSGAKQISIHGNLYDVKANIEKIDSYSGHADYKEIIEFLKCQNPVEVKQTFIVHGEYNAQLNLKKELENIGFRNITIPEKNQEYLI